MKHFIESVRLGEVKGPQQKGFTLAMWQSAFDRIKAIADMEEVELFASGQWFFHEFQKVRKLWTQGSKEFSKLTVLDQSKALIGYANREWSVLQYSANKEIKSSKTGTFFPLSLENMPVQSEYFKNVDLSAAVEILVDGLRFPLSMISQEDGSVKEVNPQCGLGLFMFIVNTGQYYHALEQAWLDCVWNGYRVLESKDETVISRKNTQLDLQHAVSSFRRASLITESAGLGASWWTDPKNVSKRNFLLSKSTIGLHKSARRFAISIVSGLAFKDDLRTVAAIQICGLPAYLDPILNKQIAEFSGLSVLQICNAYHLISQIPNRAEIHMKQKGLIKRVEDLEYFVPIFFIEELLKAFEAILKVSRSQAENLFSLMTHSGDVRQQLWFHPIVRLNKETFSMIFPAIVGINFPRLFDFLMTKSKDLEHELGELFEKFVHAELVSSFNQAKIRNSLKLSKIGGAKIKIESEEEQIDLAFSIGNKIFICELKSSQYPSEPLENFNYCEVLNQARDQALRKTKFVEKNLKSALDALDLKSFCEYEKLKVFPLIVLSNPIHAGWEWCGVPVCDILILERFFSNPKMELLGYRDKGVKKHFLEKEFYATAAEAENVINTYFNHAPQVSIYEADAQFVRYPLPMFKEDTAPKYVGTRAVRPPYGLYADFIDKKDK